MPGKRGAATLRRVGAHLAWRAGRAVALTADALRRGGRDVIITPPVGLRFGNWLYLWLQAHRASADGIPTCVLFAPGMEPWLVAFPSLAGLTIARDDLHFHDRRRWDHDFRYQRFGVDFSAIDLESFVRTHLASSVPVLREGYVTINVRRGDYYAGEGSLRFGFDQIGYLDEALRAADLVHGDLIRVVSDDPEWCREHLRPLLSKFTDFPEFMPTDPVDNFLSIAGGSRLIGTNSTFSYWGGYVADVLHQGATIIMPRFHARMDQGTDAYQLDPTWNIIDGFH